MFKRALFYTSDVSRSLLRGWSGYPSQPTLRLASVPGRAAGREAWLSFVPLCGICDYFALPDPRLLVALAT